MRLEQITFTRFIASISIVIYHYGLKIFPFNHPDISFLFRSANIGVSYFFVLSGFVMIIAYGNKDKISFIDYLQKRFARLYPVYLLAILILLLFQMARPAPNKVDFEGLIVNLTMTQSWFPGYALSFNYPGWSLSVEVFFYLTFPFLYNLVYKKFGFKKTIIPVLLVFLLSQLFFHYLLYSPFYKGFPSRSHDVFFFFPLMHFNEFLIGNLAALFFLDAKLRKRNYDILIIGIMALLFLVLKFKFGMNYHNGMLAVLFVPLVFFISLNNGLLTTLSKMRPFVFLGEISYGIYILQVPIFSWGNAIMKTKYFDFISNSELIFTINLTVLIVFAGISYQYLETPLREKLNKVKFK